MYATRSVTRAAQQLGQKQPTVSIWLGQLRHHFGDPLFVRTPEGMQPTPGADALIPLVREVVDLSRQLSEWQPSFDPATAERRFTIAMADSSHITLLPKLLAELGSAAPGVELAVARIGPDTPEGLRTGAVSLAIGVVTELQAGFYQQTLFTQDWVCLARRRHPRIARRLDREGYEAEAHIDVLGGLRQQLLESAVGANRVRRRVTLVLPGYLGLSRILVATDLVGTLPRHIATRLAEGRDLVLHECPFQISRFSTRQYWHARYHHDEANRWLRTVCARLFASPSGPPSG